MLAASVDRPVRAAESGGQHIDNRIWDGFRERILTNE
jgi:hypothetical protein